VILKSFPRPQKMCIVKMQMVCLDHWAMFITQKSGGFR
jgi:hypothetical protein